MSSLSIRRAFALFHAVLGLVILIQSIAALRRGLVLHTAGPIHTHLAILAGAEALAAILFLIPKTLDFGAIALLIIFAVALLLHGIRGQLNLLVYAAGVYFVMMHGSTFSREIFRLHKEPT